MEVLMGKDPAFLFYPGDWHLGTMHLTLTEKGCYLELLMLQFSKGKFTIENAKHMLKDSFQLAWPNVSEKFQTDGKYFWNQRLAEEKEKRAKFTESRRNNASVKNKSPSKFNISKKDMPKHMENVNENIIEIINETIVSQEVEMDLPFVSEKFGNIWNALLNSKKWKGKSKTAIKMALVKLSRHTEDDAILMVENSIAGEWQGLFEINNKNKTYEKGTSDYNNRKAEILALNAATENILSNPENFKLK